MSSGPTPSTTTLPPTAHDLFSLRHVALGHSPPSLVLRHAHILSLHTGEILPRDVLISGRHIAAVTAWDHFPRYTEEGGGGGGPKVEEVELKGKFISPGFIDTHVHVEYTKLVPGELGRLSVARGTTAVVGDANCIANVLGTKGMDFMGTTSTPLRIFRQVSHKVPSGSPDIELGGTSVSTAEICERVARPEAAALGESNPFSLDFASAEKQAAALQAGKRITGHTALLKNEPLWAYAAGGISDDHNAHRPEDVIERLRLGLMLTVMSGSMNSNIPSVFSDIERYKDGLNHMSFCADDKLVEDLDSQGHIDYHVRESIKRGLTPIQAYKIATLNAATYYRLDHLIGSITPAKLADLLILDNLEDARPETVIVNGVIVAQNNKPLFENNDPIPSFTLNTLHVDPVFCAPETYHIRPHVSHQESAWVQAMEMYDGYFKRAFHVSLSTDPKNGHLLCDTSRDVLKVVVIDRHHATPNKGIGFVRGFGLKKGAIACTTNCENQNLVVVGTSDEEISCAVRAMVELGGGFIAVAAGKVLGSVKLDVAGCMSSAPWEEVRDYSLALDKAVREELGGTMHAPFMIASFIGLAGVPDLGLTELGLVDCKTQGLMDVVLEEEKGGLNKEGGQPSTVDVPIVRVCCRCPSHAHDVHKFMDAAAAGIMIDTHG